MSVLCDQMKWTISFIMGCVSNVGSDKVKYFLYNGLYQVWSDNVKCFLHNVLCTNFVVRSNEMIPLQCNLSVMCDQKNRSISFMMHYVSTVWSGKMRYFHYHALRQYFVIRYSEIYHLVLCDRIKWSVLRTEQIICPTISSNVTVSCEYFVTNNDNVPVFLLYISFWCNMHLFHIFGYIFNKPGSTTDIAISIQIL